MKLPLLQVSTQVLLYLLGLFALLNISEAIPIRDGISGIESDVWHDTAVRKFYGPWSAVHKLNGEDADYNDYGVNVQDFGPGPEENPVYEPEVVESVPADFQSNYGEFEGDEAAILFQPSSARDQSVGDQNNADEIIVDTDPENHDLEGNVQWTSAAT